MRTLIGILAIILFSFVADLAVAEQDTRDLRSQFAAANSVTPPELVGRVFSCETELLYNGVLDKADDLFRFQPVLHNDYMLYSRSNPKLPRWFPAWFSWNGTMQTTVTYKTHDFLNDPNPCSSFFDCLQDGDAREGKAYLRLGAQDDLFVEWTTLGEADGLPASVSDAAELVFAYSQCEWQQTQYR